MGSGVTAADTQGAREQPQKAGFAKGDGRTTVPQAHAVWNTTPLSLVRGRKIHERNSFPCVGLIPHLIQKEALRARDRRSRRKQEELCILLSAPGSKFTHRPVNKLRNAPAHPGRQQQPSRCLSQTPPCTVL